jgi:flagellar export protein FliJ
MKRFAFRLQSLLTQRSRIEERCTEELRRVRVDLNAAHNDLRAIEVDSRRVRQQQQRQVTEGNLAQARLTQDYLHALKSRCRKQQQLIDTLQQELKRRQAAFLTARRERQAVETLRQRDLETYRQKTLREQQKEVDEIACQRHG